MQNILILAIGGALGALSRYIISGSLNQMIPTNFPTGTLAVNLTGSLIIGLLWGVLNMESLPTYAKHLVFIGFLGSFTTFSTFSMETFQLFEQGNIKLAIVNILVSNIGGILLAFTGYQAGKYLGG